MFDGMIRRRIDPGLDRAGRWCVARGISADGMTLAGLALGLVASALVAVGAAGAVVLIPLLANRLADGLDGAIAKATRRTDFGGYLDILCDFLFYGAVPLAFVIRDPDANGLAGALLLTSFYVNGTSFLGYAAVAAKRGMTTELRGQKSLYFTAGLLEGSETIAFFVALCLWPQSFASTAPVFAALCLVTALSRALLAWRVFGRGG